jgi:hypothetical protein
MSFDTTIAKTRQAIADDPAKAHVVFTAQGTLVGVGIDGGARPGLSAVRVEVTAAGPESAERYAELATAVDEHCPVLDLFQNPVPVSRTLHLADPARNPAGR